MSASRKKKALNRVAKRRDTREKRLKEMLDLYDRYGPRKKLKRRTGKLWR